nr:uncharacterized protein LOC112095696 [Ipomoea batatas]
MASSISVLLEERYTSLKPAEEEEGRLEFCDEDVIEVNKDHVLALVGRLLAEKAIKFHILKDTMAAVFWPGKSSKARSSKMSTSLERDGNMLTISRGSGMNECCWRRNNIFDLVQP